MPRFAHLHYPGGVFHVVTRTVGGKYVFDAAGAREDYLGRLGEALGKTDAQLLSYCLMSNHVHLVLIHGQAPLEGLFKRVHVGFAGHVHHKPGRRRTAQGAVFAQRPRRVLVEEDAYLLELVRYVHNNPVRAGVVRHASQSRWSSHGAYVGQRDCKLHSRAPRWPAPPSQMNAPLTLVGDGRLCGLPSEAIRDLTSEVRALTGFTDGAAFRAVLVAARR